MRTLAITNPFMQGEDVRHAQTMLNKYLGTHAPHLAVDGKFGNVTGQNCRIAKLRLGYPKSQCHRTYGPTLDKYLTGKLKPKPSMVKRAKQRQSIATGVDKIRASIVANAKWGVAHAGSIHYSQSRPIDGLRQPHKLPLYTDCSGFATDCYKWAGAPDPNGLAYNGQGYTGSLLNHMTEIDKSQMKPGDLIVFGYFPGHHVVIYIGNGLCISHGGEGDPKQVPVSYEDSGFSGPTHYLRTPGWH